MKAGAISVIAVLSALLVATVYFAHSAWTALGSAEEMPPWFFRMMIGGVFFSVVVGGGLMGLVFYSSRAGYDDEAGHNDGSGAGLT